ncbi:MAG: molybdopterin cofactor-binding domain-containing protein [Bdellovibrionota bacterium]|nr:molybdopterin cofactor-binding domain-containing protein [Bdellovibrionota bacterium]
MIGKNVKHDSSFGHVTGSSIFIDDRPPVKGEIQVGVVGAPVAAGKLKNILYKEALELPGILAVYTHEDLSHNSWGAIFKTQPLLVEDQIGHLDEPVAVIAAENREVLLKAKKLIKIEVEEEKPIFTIDDAIKKEDYVYKATPIVKGDVEKALKSSPRILEGNFECGGQEHFYLESQASIVYPLENGQLEVHSSSQHPTETQHLVAEAVGLPFHQVTCTVKRMGGGFGGKESQAAPFAAYAGLCAYNLNRPARIALTKDEDMAMTGKRHPFKNFYKVGFDSEGKILALKADLYSDAGPYADLSSAILERAMFHIDSAYFIPEARITGTCCKTNLPSNTAFRGFGGPQGTMTIESIIEDIAFELGKDPAEIRKINLYGKEENNVTHYGQVIDHNPLPEIYNEIFSKTEYQIKRKEVDSFNKKNNGKVRGLALSFGKFGIAFTAKFLNQGNALVNIHLDGTIQFSTGATEMGQGVNTKIQQIIAHAFGLPVKAVQAMPTSTEKNHNTSPTAASSGSDINGAAALKACNQIKERLRIILHKHWSGEVSDGVKELELEDCGDLSHILFEDNMVIDSKNNNKIKFTEALGLAYMNRVSLGGYAHFKTKGIGFDKEKSVGKPFNYFTNGAAVCEVEIDEFTGELKVLTTDILMDLGRPINPGIDQGQVTGAFIQAMGWVTQESLYFSDKGKLLSHSPTTYKIPNIQDTPRKFSVNFIENNNNHQCVHRSKAVGEPPFLLGISAFLAIKNALSYRKGKVDLKSPATNERILEVLYKE